MRLRNTVLAAGLTLAIAAPGFAGTINLTNDGTGSAAGNAVGSGDLDSIMQAAADLWCAALPQISVNITYDWAGLSGGTLGVHQLTGQGGSPNRETDAYIRFDNDGSSVFYMDSTPFDNSEWTTYTESASGGMNTGRVYTGATGLAAGRFDLFSIALHEIGHALGLSSANTSFQAENGDGDIDLTSPRPFAGTDLDTISGAHLNIISSLMYPSFSAGTRKTMSAADILANAQISQFTQWDLDPSVSVVPLPPAAWMGLGLLGGLGLLRRRRTAA